MPSVLATQLGRAIRREREKRDIAQEKFAVLIKRHRTFAGTLERGQTNPSLDTLERVAAALDMPVWELLRRATDPKAEEHASPRLKRVAERTARPTAPPKKRTR